MGTEKSLLSRIATWAVIGILAIIALKIVGRLLAFVVGLVGMVFGIAMFLIFTVAPVVLLGWLAMKGWRAFAKEPAV
jgi:hypothetical protein